MASLQTAVSVSLDTLRLNPLRSVLSTLGVIIGVASLVAVLSLGDGMERSARQRIEMTTDLQSVGIESRMQEDIDGQSFALRDTVSLTGADLDAVQRLPLVGSATLVARGGVEVRSRDSTKRRMAALLAVSPGFAKIRPANLVAGRFLSGADIAAGVAVISRRLSQDLAGARAEDALGDTVLVNGRATVVVGVISGELGASRGLFVPFAPGLDTSLRVNALRYPSLVVRAARVEDVAAVERSVRTYLAASHPASKRAFAVQTSQARAREASQGILIFKLLMGAITGISLIVGGIGIMNVLLASVTERTREIGIRKTTGARHRDILLQFLAESVAITGIGSLIGIVLGLGGAFGVTALIRRFAEAGFIQATFSWGSVLVAALLSVLIGVAFGTYPALRAARLSPIEAIRHE
jgi:putative ABC transport system permease protein